MSGESKGLGLTLAEIQAVFERAHWAEKFPPILSAEQAAELLQVPKATLYDWSSRKLLTDCCQKVGKHLRFWRDRLILKIFN